MALSLIVALSLVTSFVAYKLLQRLRFKLPPGPRPLPFVGNLYNLKPVLVRCFTEWSQVYGPIFSVYMGSQLSIIVNSAELAKQVLKDNDLHLANRPKTGRANVLTKNGMNLIWSDYGPHYVKLKKLCNLELFSTKRVEQLRPIREDEVTAMVESIFKDSVKPENKGKGLVLRDYLGMMAFLHITRLSYGKRFVDSDGGVDKQGQELKDIGNLAQTARPKGQLDFLPRVPFLVNPQDQIVAEIVARSDNFTRTIMEEYNIEPNRTGDTESHFIGALLTLRKEYELSEGTILALIWDMIAAGADTVTITVEWAMAEMIRNPRVQRKAREELDRVVGSDRIMTETDIPNLPYLRCVTKECLRMHPPTPLMLPHKAGAKVELGGFDIPKGAIVSVNVWAIARDPTVWKDPLEFRPERFQEESIDMKGTDYRLLPFGSGRRVCPGAQMAINLVTSTLGHMLHHFDWVPPAGIGPQDMDMMERPGVVAYMRTPVRAVPTPRLPSHLFKRVAVIG